MMKKIIVLAIAAAAASSSFAATGVPGFDLGSGVKLTGSTGAVSAYNWRGAEMSNGEPSMNASVGVEHKSGLFANGTLNTVNVGEAKYQTNLTAGYKAKVGEVGLKGGLFYSHFNGNRASAIAAEDLAFTEVFVGGDWRGVGASLHYNVNGSDAQIDRMRKGDIYGSLGYMHKIGDFAVGAEVGYYWYDRDGQAGVKNNFADQRIKSAYQVSPNFKLTAEYQLGGKDAFNTAWAHNDKFEIGAKYDF